MRATPDPLASHRVPPHIGVVGECVGLEPGPKLHASGSSEVNRNPYVSFVDGWPSRHEVTRVHRVHIHQIEHRTLAVYLNGKFPAAGDTAGQARLTAAVGVCRRSCPIKSEGGRRVLAGSEPPQYDDDPTLRSAVERLIFVCS